MNAHTPGPLMVEGPSKPTPDTPLGGDFAICDGGTNIIAEVFHQVGIGSYRPAEANAYLFDAAPELLAACQLLIEQYDAVPEFMMASAALAKAMGERA